jgi:ankyrin repeat protein
MSLPELPPELLLMIAHHIRDDDGELRYRDFNSFLRVNRALYACLNRMLWKEAGEWEVGNQRVLTHLIDTKNLSRLELFLELGADVEVQLPAFNFVGEDPSQNFAPTPLVLAADMDDVPLARLLLEKGAAEVQYVADFSPLHAASSAEMVQLLLDHNADPNFKDNAERTPLHYYAMGDEDDIGDDIGAMRAILQHGADANPTGPHGEKPIHEAVLLSLGSVQLLVEHGADVQARDHIGNTPLHSAADAGKTDVVRFLAERWPEGMRVTNQDLQTPLHLAIWPFGESLQEAAQRNLDSAQLLVEHGADVQARDHRGNTPLHMAAAAGKLDMVRLLVGRWPEGKEALNNRGKTPLSRFRGFQRVLQLPFIDEEEIIVLLGGRPWPQENLRLAKHKCY